MEDEVIEVTEEERAERAQAAAEIWGDEVPPAPERSAAVEEEIVEEPEHADAEPESEPVAKPEDPWAGVSPAVKQTLEAIQGKMSAIDTLEYRLKQAESRVGSIQNELFNANKAATKVDDAPSKKEMRAAAESAEKWESLKDEYPDWAEAISEGIAAKSAESQQAIESLQRKITQLEQAGPTQNHVDQNIQKDLLSIFHPDWERTLQDPQYQNWLVTQPTELQALVNSPRAADAKRVLDGFNEFKKKLKSPTDVQKQRKQRLVQSQEVRGKPAKPSKAEADMSEAEFRKKLAGEIWKD